ncbi:MAG: thioesterase family protein [Simkaniaceae bacterium]
MFKYSTKIFMRGTDMTGILYFTELPRMAAEAFEFFLDQKEVSIRNGKFFLPIVHLNTNYFSPFEYGDKVEVDLSSEKIGKSSFTLKSRFFLGSLLKSEVEITHVVVAKGGGASQEIPDDFRLLLEELK